MNQNISSNYNANEDEMPKTEKNQIKVSPRHLSVHPITNKNNSNPLKSIQSKITTDQSSHLDYVRRSKNKPRENKKIRVKIPHFLKVIQQKTAFSAIYVMIPILVCYIFVIFNSMEIFLTNFIGIVFPVYWSLRGLDPQYNNIEDEKQWFTYWLIFLSSLPFDVLFGSFLKYIPFYYVFKYSFLCWMFLPNYNGASFIHDNVIKKYFPNFEIIMRVKSAHENFSKHINKIGENIKHKVVGTGSETDHGNKEINYLADEKTKQKQKSEIKNELPSKKVTDAGEYLETEFNIIADREKKEKEIKEEQEMNYKDILEVEKREELLRLKKEIQEEYDNVRRKSAQTKKTMEIPIIDKTCDLPNIKGIIEDTIKQQDQDHLILQKPASGNNITLKDLLEKEKEIKETLAIYGEKINEEETETKNITTINPSNEEIKPFLNVNSETSEFKFDFSENVKIGQNTEIIDTTIEKIYGRMHDSLIINKSLQGNISFDSGVDRERYKEQIREKNANLSRSPIKALKETSASEDKTLYDKENVNLNKIKSSQKQNSALQKNFENKENIRIENLDNNIFEKS